MWAGASNSSLGRERVVVGAGEARPARREPLGDLGGARPVGDEVGRRRLRGERCGGEHDDEADRDLDLGEAAHPQRRHAGVARHPRDDAVVHGAEDQQHHEQHDLGRHNDAVGGSVDRLDRADIVDRHDEPGSDQQRDGPDQQKREAPAEQSVRADVMGAVERQQEVRNAADPRRRRRHVEEIGGQQHAAALHLRGCVAGGELRGERRDRQAKQREDAGTGEIAAGHEGGRGRRGDRHQAEAREGGAEGGGERNIQGPGQHHAFEHDDRELGAGERQRRPDQQPPAAHRGGGADGAELFRDRADDQAEKHDPADRQRLRRQHEAAQHDAEVAEDVEQQRHRFRARR